MTTNPKQLQGDYKVPLHLVPPGLEIYAAMALGEGGLWKEVPYGPYNFRDSQVEAMTYIGGMLRHIKDYLDGYDIDPDSPVNKPSLAGVAGSLAILIDATENGNLIDNRPKKGNARAMMDRFEGEIRAMKQRVADNAEFERDAYSMDLMEEEHQGDADIAEYESQKQRVTDIAEVTPPLDGGGELDFVTEHWLLTGYNWIVYPTVPRRRVTKGVTCRNCGVTYKHWTLNGLAVASGERCRVCS